MSLKIFNDGLPQLDSLRPLITSLYSFVKEKMGFDEDASVHLISDPENAEETLGRTAYYNPSEKKIVIYVNSRHPKDILRSISHETVHHAQKCRGDLDGHLAFEDGYMQTNKHLRTLEEEAYSLGSGAYMRDWEAIQENVKKNRTKGDQIMQEWKKAKYFEVGQDILTEGMGEKEPLPKGKTGKKALLQGDDAVDVAEEGDTEELGEMNDVIEDLEESIKQHYEQRHRKIGKALFKRFITDKKGR